MKRIVTLGVLVFAAGTALARLPTPVLSDEAKAKAADAAAKAAHGNKVADYQLCKSMDRVAAAYAAEAKKSGKTVTPTATPPCVDPGVFGAAATAPAATALPAGKAPTAAVKPPAKAPATKG